MSRLLDYKDWILAAVFLFFFSLEGRTQREWTLDNCVDYACAHNISISSAQWQAQLQENVFRQSRSNRFPTLNFSTSLASQFGRSIDPTTNVYTNTQISYNSMEFKSGAMLFNWFSVRNTVRYNSKNAEVANLETERLKSDLKLNIIAAYLQLLLAEKQLEISKEQIKLTLQQLEITGRQVEYGKKPESDWLQLVGELSSDSSSYFRQLLVIQKAKLQIMQLLNLDPKEGFEVAIADTTMEARLPVLENPEYIYEMAKMKHPLQKVNRGKLEALSYQRAISKAAFYPKLSASAAIASNYSNSYLGSFGRSYGYLEQLFNINLYQYVGLSLSVPIFNSKTVYYNYRNIGVQIRLQQLQSESDDQQLKQNIYEAYSSANTNLSVYLSSKRALDATEKGYVMSQKRFEIGKSTLSDYLIALNVLFQAKADCINAYYSYIFSIKILAYYKMGSS